LSVRPSLVRVIVHWLTIGHWLVIVTVWVFTVLRLHIGPRQFSLATSLPFINNNSSVHTIIGSLSIGHHFVWVIFTPIISVFFGWVVRPSGWASGLSTLSSVLWAFQLSVWPLVIRPSVWAWPGHFNCHSLGCPVIVQFHCHSLVNGPSTVCLSISWSPPPLSVGSVWFHCLAIVSLWLGWVSGHYWPGSACHCLRLGHWALRLGQLSIIIGPVIGLHWVLHYQFFHFGQLGLGLAFNNNQLSVIVQFSPLIILSVIRFRHCHCLHCQ